MYFRFNAFNLWLVVVFMILAAGCNKRNKEIKKTGQVPPNSFSMAMNNRPWEPSIIGGDSCHVAGYCNWSAVDNIPFYTIQMYRDPDSEIDDNSRNVFRLQIMNLSSPGVYYVNEPFSDFTSYARLSVNKAANRKIYENGKADRLFKVVIEKMLPKQGSSLVGIKGTFSGVLYNIENQGDSIVIDDGQFVFSTVNHNGYGWCND